MDSKISALRKGDLNLHAFDLCLNDTQRQQLDSGFRRALRGSCAFVGHLYRNSSPQALHRCALVWIKDGEWQGVCVC